MKTIHDVSIGDLVIKPIYGRIEDLWIGNQGIWTASVNGISIPLRVIEELVPKKYLGGV